MLLLKTIVAIVNKKLLSEGIAIASCYCFH
jgi:hypothetical protein